MKKLFIGMIALLGCQEPHFDTTVEGTWIRAEKAIAIDHLKKDPSRVYGRDKRCSKQKMGVVCTACWENAAGIRSILCEWSKPCRRLYASDWDVKKYGFDANECMGDAWKKEMERLKRLHPNE